MKRTITLGLIILAAALIAFSQADKKEAQAKLDLMQLERDIGKANIDNDYVFFNRVEAEEFIFTDAGGGVTNKKQDLEGLKQAPNPDVKLMAYDVDDMNVRLYDKTAVVTGRHHETTGQRSANVEPESLHGCFCLA